MKRRSFIATLAAGIAGLFVPWKAKAKTEPLPVLVDGPVRWDEPPKWLCLDPGECVQIGDACPFLKDHVVTATMTDLPRGMYYECRRRTTTGERWP